MKDKIITCVFFILFLAAQGHAKSSYYYYKGERIPIEISNDSVYIYTQQNTMIKGDMQITYFPKTVSTDITIKENDKTITSIEYIIVGDNKKNVKMSNRFYVQLFDSVADINKLQHIAIKTNTTILGQVPHMPDWYILVVNNSIINNSLEMSNYFYETGLFKNTDPGFIFNFSSSSSCVSDTHFNAYQWGMQAINACDAWMITKGSSNIKIAIIDKEIYQSHQEYYPVPANKFIYTHNCMQTPTPAYNAPWHGSMSCGIIAANHNNYQIAGIAPVCKIIPIAHNLNSSDLVSEELAEGILWAVNHGADVINCSWGDHNGLITQLHSELLESAIQTALTNGRNGKGCVVVFASGNENSSQIDYPAYVFPNILTVGSTAQTLHRSYFSSYGNNLDIVAPGENIYSTDHTGSYNTDNGTSYAAPHVSGVAGLILSVNPSLTQTQVVNIIESTAQKVGGYSYTNHTGRPNGTWNDSVGYGLVDAYAAVQKAADLNIEGPQYLGDSAWYYVRNVPQGATITWNISNKYPLLNRYVLASEQGRDSMYISFRNALDPHPSIPPGIINSIGDNDDPNLFPIVIPQLGYLSVTLTLGNSSYTIKKTIREPESNNPSSMPRLHLATQTEDAVINVQMPEGLDKSLAKNAYSLELWHSIYGRMWTQAVHNFNEQIPVANLLQGVYVLVLKENENIIAQTKVLIK